MKEAKCIYYNQLKVNNLKYCIFHNIGTGQDLSIAEMINDLNPLDSKGNYRGTSNNTQLLHWLLTGGLLHLVQQGGPWAGCGPALSPGRHTKCNSPPNHCIAI